jgi:type I site-specific restriction-modification system R (restriction) subunit
MFKERPFGPKPETKNKEQRNYTDKLIESVRKEPHAYRPLRKDVDAGLMTRDQAFEVLKAWQKVIEEQEIAWKKNNKDELQQILSSENYLILKQNNVHIQNNIE